MKKIAILSTVMSLMSLVSCGPTYFSLGVEMRNPSRSGIELAGKNISVTYLDDGNDSLFISSIAEGFTEALEKDYYNGEQHIGIYRIDGTAGSGYASRDSMVNLLMDTGVDLAFLFDVEYDSVGDSVSDVPFELKLYVYDGMDSRDTVRMFKGEGAFKQALDISDQGYEAGRNSSLIFVSAWSEQRYVFYYYDSSSDWCQAAGYASEYKFREAMDIWMRLLDTGNMLKRACAEYNIAAVCCIMGEKELAVQWLDRADAVYQLPYSSTLRSRIAAR